MVIIGTTLVALGWLTLVLYGVQRWHAQQTSLLLDANWKLVEATRHAADQMLTGSFNLCQLVEKIVYPPVVDQQLENPDTTGGFYNTLNPFADLPDPNVYLDQSPDFTGATETDGPPADPMADFGDPASLPPELLKVLGWEHYANKEEDTYGS